MKKIATITVMAAIALAGCSAGDDDQAPPSAPATQEKEERKEQAQKEAQQTQEEAEKWVKEVLNIDGSWGNTNEFAPEFSAYANEAKVEHGKLVVTMQIDRGDAHQRDLAERANLLLKNSATVNFPEHLKQVDWIVMEDGAGSFISQERVDS